MNKKKAIIVIMSILAGLALLVVLFVGAITGFIFYTIGNSEAAQTAKAFLQQNEKLKRDIGEVRDFGTFVTGKINTQNADGDATIGLKVIGAKQTVSASVQMVYQYNQSWRVTGASYVNAAGKTVELIDKYESEPEPGIEPETEAEK